jgi:hypothetical protein
MFETLHCRFCSQEHLFVPYSTLVENPATKRLCVGSTGIKKEMIGFFCNNISDWVSNLKYCPARWGLHGVASSGCVADGTGSYVEPVKVASVLFRSE